MKLACHLPHLARTRVRAASVAALVAVLSSGLVLPLGVAHAATAVPLGTAESFAVLAGSTITNTGPTTITGDVGLDPGTAVTGYDDVTHEGSLHVDDDVALQAKTDLDTAYTNAAGQTPATEIPTELGGTTLKAGIYDSAAGTFGVTGTLTLDGEGDPDAVFIFQMASTLTTASASNVALINGADLCNVYWQVGSSATLGSNSAFVGTIMADQSITLDTGATVQGRVLARSGAVTLDTNTITSAACATPTDTDDDTTSDDDTTGGDDTTGEDDTTNGDDTDGSDTTDQVVEVPAGPVATGGGGVETAAPGLWARSAAVLVLLLVGGTVGLIARRRVRG
jgi:hypothetical protein